MDTKTTDQRLSDLLPQISDLLALPQDIDLPPLYSVECRRRYDASGWTVRGHLWQDSDEQAWEHLSEWAGAAVAQIELGHEYGTTKRERKASITVVVGNVAVEIWTAVAASFVPPNACCVESYQLKDACAECKAPAEAPKVSHMAAYTQSGRDTGHAVCGAAEGVISHDDDSVTCLDCHEQQDEQYESVRRAKAASR